VEEFFPAAFGWHPESEETRARAALPVRHGGLALPDPCELASTERLSAQRAVCHLAQAILSLDLHRRQEAAAR
jgi:hypothetical protein